LKTITPKVKNTEIVQCFRVFSRNQNTNNTIMSQSRRERRKADRDKGKALKKFIGLHQQRDELEKKFADTFREYGLDPYGVNSEQFQEALKTHIK